MFPIQWGGEKEQIKTHPSIYHSHDYFQQKSLENYTVQIREAKKVIGRYL